MKRTRVKEVFRSLRIVVIRLPLNLRSNRWYVVLGRQLYVASPRESHAFRNEVVTRSLASGSPNFRVYRRFFTPRRPATTAAARSNDAILLPNLGRFGNAVREVVSAVSVARSLEIGHVFLAGDNVFASGSDVPSPGSHATAAGPQVWIDRNPPLKPSFSRLIRWSRNDYRLDSEVRDVEWESMREALSLQGKPGDSSAVTIHLRGGDVFGTREAKNYGQPPLSFYQKVLEHCRARHVHIVYQDELNPVLTRLISLCEEKSIGYTTQSGSLTEDIETLMGAQTLAVGRGTFLPAVVGLSDHIKRVYYFEDKFTLQPPRNGFEVFRVFDSHGEYRRSVLSGNWENRPEQRALMLSYPASRLKLEREG